MSEARTADTAAIVQEVTALLARSEVVQAVDLARKALDSGAEAPLLLNLRAYWLEGEKRPRDALTDLKRARVLAPDDPMVLNALGLCLAKLGRLDQASEAFQQCVALAPEFAPGHFNCGWSFEELGEFDAARDAFEAAARIDSRSPVPAGRLAALAARRGHWDAVRGYAERAFALEADHAAAVIALAGADLAAKSYGEAKRRLGQLIDSTIISPQDRATAVGLLGDVLDAQAQYRDAFAAYSGSNKLFKTIFAERLAAQSQMPMGEYIEWLSTAFARSGPWSKSGRTEPAAGEGPSRHIFLLGFPRSGTTLLEEVLACHPDVSTTGEKDALDDIVLDALAVPSHLEQLRTLGDREASRYRARYWTSLQKFGVPVEGRILIDKQPFNTVRLPLIARLFPDAKIIFCLRDPRDVVLSCFRRRFSVNGANVEFLDLERAAGLYDAVMRLAASFREKLPIQVHEIKNEDLVDNFESEMRALCAFVGIEWMEEFRDFAQRSSARQVVTPSAVQIQRGLGREGIGHWRNYAMDMTPILPLMNAWAEKLGYE
jgi:tetratricopeptide (TPR) repeat protein